MEDLERSHQRKAENSESTNDTCRSRFTSLSQRRHRGAMSLPRFAIIDLTLPLIPNLYTDLNNTTAQL